MLLVFHWFKYTEPSLNGQTSYEENGDFSHGEQQVSVVEKPAEYFTSCSIGDWVRRLVNDITRSGDNENTSEKRKQNKNKTKKTEITKQGSLKAGSNILHVQ